MSLYIEEEGELRLPFDTRKIAEAVTAAALDHEGCPYEAQINLLLTTDEDIRKLNNTFRGIDKATDVLSFPMIEYAAPADFSAAENGTAGLFDPDSGELILGDIVISKDRVLSQAKAYGHSPEREYAFLIAHSMLHLSGYDHMQDDERERMEKRQEEILKTAGFSR